MLQFATSNHSRHSIGEQIKTALDAGCGWIRITGKPDASVVEEAIPPCQEAQAILVLDDDIKLVDRLRIHGLHLTQWSRGSVIAAREELGPHAILGVTCPDATKVGELSALDVDYMVVPAPDEGNPVDFYISLMEKIKGIKSEIHIVAAGNLPVSIYPAILATGVEGFEISGDVLDAPDPSSFITLALNTLK